MKTLLSIDGGGIFGILPAALLADLERRTGKPCAALFDLIAGNSTGGIIACGLAAGVPAQALLGLYVEKGALIFSRSVMQELRSGDGAFGPRYSAAMLEAELKSILGSRWLSDVDPVQLLVPTSVVQAPMKPGALFFKSWKARGVGLDPGDAPDGHDYPLWQVARATSAAPCYFPTAAIADRAGRPSWCIDGGIHTNNPSMAALAAAEELWPGAPVRLLSLGTGRGKNANLDGAATVNWGAAEWLLHLVQIAMADTAEAANHEAEMALGPDHLRCDIDMTGAPGLDTAFDDAGAANVAAISALAAALVSQDGEKAAAFVAGGRRA